MDNILKRLEIIRKSIELEDLDIIELQIKKLKEIELESEVKEIIESIKRGVFTGLIERIDEYLKKYNGLILYSDEEIQELQIELRFLENQIQDISETKAEYLKLINDFNYEYNLRLGEYIEKLLELRLTVLKEKINQEANTEEEKKKKAEYQKEYTQTREEYKTFQDEQTKVKEEIKSELTDDEKKELKALFRKGSKLCHPDVVDDEFKAKAQGIFTAMNNAYQNGDLETLRKILNDLENGLEFIAVSNKTQNKEKLQKQIEIIRAELQKLNDEINEIKQDETFNLIENIDDWEIYFQTMKEKLQNEIKDHEK